MNIRILRKECCGNAECVRIAPEVFALDSKNKAVVVEDNAVSWETILEAAEACPCTAIEVVDDNGKRLFP